MGDGSQGLDVANISRRIAYALAKDGSRAIVN